jgi:hypothetical protein
LRGKIELKYLIQFKVADRARCLGSRIGRYPQNVDNFVRNFNMLERQKGIEADAALQHACCFGPVKESVRLLGCQR